jgi:hypothetical protein
VAPALTQLQNDLRNLKESTEADVSSLRNACAPPRPRGWNSAIVPDFPKLFEDFKDKQFTLLWRGSRDGFGARDFHSRCDWHPSTLTVILDTKGNIFGGFTPTYWAPSPWPGEFKADLSLKSFLFTLRNPHNFPPSRFALKAEKKYQAIDCDSDWCPIFSHGIAVANNCNANINSCTEFFGNNYTNDTGLNGKTFFTGSKYFQVKEIEVFMIIN